nr:response regulator transcription factor [Campylobacterota bacterium]
KTSGSEAAVKISSLIETKIIFLTAYFDQEMMDYALEAGAVNYLIKPYKEKQILAALEIALRQTDTKSSKQQTHTSIPLMCDYIYNTQKQRLYRNEKEVSLSKKSLLLIHCLVLNINSTVSKEELSHYIYGENKDSSTIRTLVFRLRKQLECDMIENISGLGYKIVSD